MRYSSTSKNFWRARAPLATAALVVAIASPTGGVAHAAAPTCKDMRVLGDETANLRAVLRQLSLDRPRRRQHSRDLMKLWRGALGFFLPFPGGNGRACATCHNPKDGFSISPRTVEARWQALQRARLEHPCADDPLFRAMDDDDDQQGNFSLLRSRALFAVKVPLPPHVRLTDDPAATEVTLRRAVPALDMLKHTAPYQQDRSAPTLEQQALGAVNMHMQPAAPPGQDFLDSVADFQRHLFSSARAEAASHAIDAGATEVDYDGPRLNKLEKLGQQRFDDLCARCHGGPAQVRNLENRIFPPFDGSTNPVSLNVVVSNPPPAGFPASPIHGPGFDLPTRRYTVHLPDGSTTILPSSDPGTVLTDPRALDKVAGNQVFNRFDIPQLRGINATAPYFHDHRARTLEDVVKHYQAFFAFIRLVRGLPLPLIEDADIAPLVAYMRKAL
jgi:hypothetical protein